MKKTRKSVGKVLIPLVLVLVLAVGGFFVYQVRTPEYALYRTYQDIQESGVDGLKPHLTGSASLLVEGIDTIVSGISGLFSQFTQEETDYTALLIDHLKEIDWTVEDVLRGKEQATVVLGFTYQGDPSGTVRVDMVLEDGEWLISGISDLHFD